MRHKQDTIGRFEIGVELGRGSMGIVHRAHDPLMGRDVAIKTVLLPQGLSPQKQDEFHERFLREARAAGRLSHPGIVTIYDFNDGPDSGRPFIAMEYVEGPTLHELICAEGSLSPNWVLSVGETLADALQCAHDAGIVHRDLKPANILVREADGVAKISDFGVARINQAELTGAGGTYGSPAYMAPERLRGTPADARSDLFALAVILYEVLCGRRPFGGDDFAQTCAAILNESAPSIRRREPDLTPAFDVFFARALAKNPDERFQTGAALRDALRALREEQECFRRGGVATTALIEVVIESESGGNPLAAAEATPGAALSPDLASELGPDLVSVAGGDERATAWPQVSDVAPGGAATDDDLSLATPQPGLRAAATPVNEEVENEHAASRLDEASQTTSDAPDAERHSATTPASESRAERRPATPGTPRIERRPAAARGPRVTPRPVDREQTRTATGSPRSGLVIGAGAVLLVLVLLAVGWGTRHRSPTGETPPVGQASTTSPAGVPEANAVPERSAAAERGANAALTTLPADGRATADGSAAGNARSERAGQPGGAERARQETTGRKAKPESKNPPPETRPTTSMVPEATAVSVPSLAAPTPGQEKRAEPGTGAAQPAHLDLTIRSSIKAGTLTLLLDGKQVYTTELATESRGFSRLVKKAAGHAREEISARVEIPPGPHTLVARVVNASGSRELEESLELEIESGAARGLSIVAGKRIGPPLTLTLD